MNTNTKIITTLITVTFLLIIGIVLRYTQAADVSTSANVENTAPTVDTIRFSTTAYGTDNLTSSGILPNVGTDRTIHINGTITDLNGEDDIASSTISLVFYRISKGNTCTADKNDCYRIATCASDYQTGNDTAITYNCEVSLAYWIDATDSASIYETESWAAHVSVQDQATAQGNSFATIEVNSLLALNLPDAIDYSTRSLSEVSSSTTNVETPITQRGNTKADVQVKGGRMSCNVLGSLATSSQAWALTDVGHSASTILTDSFVATERNIDLRTDDNNELSANLYWNIAIPASGVKGTCTGSNTIVIVAQPTTPAPDGWTSIVDDTNWQCLANCSPWNGTYWQEVGPGLVLTSIGTWMVNYRPTKVRVSYENSASLIVTVESFGSCSNLQSGDECVLDVTADIGRIDLTSTTMGMRITDIEFYVAP